MILIKLNNDIGNNLIHIHLRYRNKSILYFIYTSFYIDTRLITYFYKHII